MNPAKLNHRIKFSQLTATQDEYGGVTPAPVELLTTWGDLQPIRQYNQAAIEAGASVLNGDKQLIIRYRNAFTPAKDMIFEDLNTPGDIYTVHAILPYYQGAKNTFQNLNEKVYKDKNFIYIVGVKRT